jgi:hypothetical protein
MMPNFPQIDKHSVNIVVELQIKHD